VCCDAVSGIAAGGGGAGLAARDFWMFVVSRPEAVTSAGSPRGLSGGGGGCGCGAKASVVASIDVSSTSSSNPSDQAGTAGAGEKGLGVVAARDGRMVRRTPPPVLPPPPPRLRPEVELTEAAAVDARTGAIPEGGRPCGLTIPEGGRPIPEGGRPCGLIPEGAPLRYWGAEAESGVELAGGGVDVAGKVVASANGRSGGLCGWKSRRGLRTAGEKASSHPVRSRPEESLPLRGEDARAEEAPEVGGPPMIRPPVVRPPVVRPPEVWSPPEVLRAEEAPEVGCSPVVRALGVWSPEVCSWSRGVWCPPTA